MKAFLAFLLVAVGVGSYFAAALLLGFFQRYPYASYAAASLGVVFLLALVAKERTRPRIVLTVLGVALLGGFLWYTLSFSVYPPGEAKLKPGDELPDVTVKASTGEELDLREEVEETKAGALLVFYRGHW